MPLRPGQRSRGGGGAARVLFAQVAVDTQLDGAHGRGATALAVDSVDGITAGMRFGCAHQTSAFTAADVTAVDTDASTITIAPGLAAALANDSAVFAAPMWGRDDTLALPAGRWHSLELQVGWQVRSQYAANVRQHGFSQGNWYAPGSAWCWTHTSSGGWYWYDQASADDDGAFAVALMPNDVKSADDFFFLNYDRDDSELAMAAADSGRHTYIPLVRALRVIGMD